MAQELEEVGRYLLQVLYDNYCSGKFYSCHTLADALEVDTVLVQGSLDKLTGSELLEQTEAGYRLSDKGYRVTYQRATSYCPHL